MYGNLLPYLRCPACRGRLTLQQPEIDRTGEIVGGQLDCAACGAGYPIRKGIADFLGAPSPPTPAQVVNELRPAAWAYELLWRPFALTLFAGEPFPYGRELPLIGRLLDPHRGGLYLDVACSNGLYARALDRTMAGAYGHVAAVDHALPMLVEGRRRARSARRRVSFIRASAQSLPIAPGVAAGVAIGGSLNEIGDLAGCLAEVRRVLAEDGRYVAMTLTGAGTFAGRGLQWLVGRGGIQFWTPDQLVREFARHGLRTVGRWQYGIVAFTCSVGD
jgi:SAM-dependent methyltransferase